MKTINVHMEGKHLAMEFEGENPPEEALCGIAEVLLTEFPQEVAAEYIKQVAVMLGFTLPKVG